MAAAVASDVGRAPAADSTGGITYKNGLGGNPLKYLDPKRQNLTANRHNWSADRQKSLALVSDDCQCVVRISTTGEVSYDGGTTQ